MRTPLAMAALASAVMPTLAITGVRGSEQTADADRASGIDMAVLRDTVGRNYDVLATDSPTGRRLLERRVGAASVLRNAKESAAFGFAIEHVLAYDPGRDPDGPTAGVAVAVAEHHEGYARALESLDADACSAVGTAIGAIHRLRPGFLTDESYPAYTTEQIHGQLVSWIARLRRAGHVPSEITRNWSRIAGTKGLWSFATCPVHGGFTDGDLVFVETGLSAVYHWQNVQINDPARDLAWIFAKLDEPHRNALIASYGRMMGSRLDELIMLRAKLWLQMEQVGDFILALNHADNDRIIAFKARVEDLAQQLAQATHTGVFDSPDAEASATTITVGTLLGNGREPDGAPGPRKVASHDGRSSSPDHADGTGAAGTGTNAPGTGVSRQSNPRPSDAETQVFTPAAGQAQPTAATLPIDRQSAGDSTGGQKSHKEQENPPAPAPSRDVQNRPGQNRAPRGDAPTA